MSALLTKITGIAAEIVTDLRAELAETKSKLEAKERLHESLNANLKKLGSGQPILDVIEATNLREKLDNAQIELSEMHVALATAEARNAELEDVLQKYGQWLDEFDDWNCIGCATLKETEGAGHSLTCPVNAALSGSTPPATKGETK